MPAAQLRRSKCFTRTGEPKRAHPDEDEAQDVRQRLIAGGASPGAVGVYWCDYCDEGYHVGRRPRSRNELRFQGTRRSKNKKGKRR